MHVLSIIVLTNKHFLHNSHLTDQTLKCKSCGVKLISSRKLKLTIVFILFNVFTTYSVMHDKVWDK